MGKIIADRLLCAASDVSTLFLGLPIVGHSVCNGYTNKQVPVLANVLRFPIYGKDEILKMLENVLCKFKEQVFNIFLSN